MHEWEILCRQPERTLGNVDVAVMNLIVAASLPGNVKSDEDRCMRRIDELTAGCRAFTERAMTLFRSGRSDYPRSEPRFRIQAMITFLQRDAGIRYHPERTADTAVYQPEDSFLHGALQGDGGTCASLPVLYTSIGRRLGYPIRLATTIRHLYCRWDEGPSGESFNIEASGVGVSFFPDEHYRTGRFQLTPREIEANGFLRSLSPREELSVFLFERAGCWEDVKNYREAVMSLAWANELHPLREIHQIALPVLMKNWHDEIHSQVIALGRFPKLDLGLPASQFLHLPRQQEREIIRMRVMSDILANPEFQQRWWKPLKKNPNRRPSGLPDVMRINFCWPTVPRSTF